MAPTISFSAQESTRPPRPATAGPPSDHHAPDKILPRQPGHQGQGSGPSHFTRQELLGAPHSVIRHPEMPRAAFHLLWEGLGAGREVFAYIVNLARNGDHYWVLAHVTPTRDRSGQVTGYHSNRRTVDRRVLPAIQQLYAELREAEQAVEGTGGTKAAAIAASMKRLDRHLERRRLCYDAYVWSL